jgi:hypothetical protein
MAACTKCRAELIGTGKFCASCGAPVEPAVVVAPTASEAQVNPFAATASPNHPIGERQSAPPAAASRPPPGEGSPISPLAISNAIAERGAFEKAMESVEGRASAAAGPPAPSANKPGTRVMPNAPKHPSKAEPPTSAASTSKKGSVPKTLAMEFQPGAEPWAQPRAPGPRESELKPQSTLGKPSSKGTQGAPQSIAVGSAPPPPQSLIAQPQSVLGQPQSGPAAYGAFSQAYGQPSASARSWQHQPNAYPVSYPFAYAPGMRVHVTWSNGQRYPATISQTTGTQCLVVFPDGQQHWVDAQYVSPG